PQVVSLGVIGYQNIGPAIAIEIGTDDPQARSRFRQPGGPCDILKPEPATPGITATIVEQPGECAWKVIGMAIIARPARWPTGKRGVIIDIVDDDQVQPAVTIIIKECCRRAPTR